MLNQVVKPSAHPNPMPWQIEWSSSAIIQVVGDLLDYLMACKNIWVEAC